MKNLKKILNLSIEDAREIEEKIREMDRIDSLALAIERLQRCLSQD
jgi:hypothetical protein